MPTSRSTTQELERRFDKILIATKVIHHFQCFNCGTKYDATANDKQWSYCPNCARSII
jgi:DNA-directed RNA polymerase subunit RPC12/RpoP